MRARVLFVLLAGLLGLQAEAVAQFSSEMPGVIRAGVPFRGGHQNRTAWDFGFYSRAAVPDESVGAGADSLFFTGRLSFGQSYRIGSRLEVGFDLAFADGLYIHPPSSETETKSIGTKDTGKYARGAALYALRIGTKFRPVQMLSPEGYGFDAAIGVGYQPVLEPVWGWTMQGDSVRMGLMGRGEEDRDPIVGKIPGAGQLAGVVSYRSRRIQADAGLSYERSFESISAEENVAGSYLGLNPQAGAMFRLTPGLAVGATWWGGGAPPWRDQIRIGLPQEEGSSFTPVVSFGSKPESGLDLVVSSPTGQFSESVRLYIRARSTR
jgi:hypothetical protein